MELITLNAANQPDKLVENYDSLIWSERFYTMGDFQLKTGNISQFMSLLPEGKIVSLRESNVPMIVETHQIERKKNSPASLTIVGRAFESILERRVAIQSLDAGAKEWSVNVKIPSDLAYYIINKICVEGILDPADVFPSSMVQFVTPSDYLTSTGPTKPFVVQRGNLLSTVLELLKTEAKADLTTSPVTPAVVPHGIRSARPNSFTSAIGVYIYQGTDRSATIRFDATKDLLDDGNYLFSKVGSATDAYILGQNQSAKMSKGTGATGLERRVALVDATSSGLADLGVLKEQGSMSLTEASETAMFDGSVNQDLSPYTYGVDYKLGDVVKVVGDYGLETKARVTEYIRSEGVDGTKSYPTLETIPA